MLAFYSCTSLTLITSLNPDPPYVNWRDVFYGVDYENCTLQVPMNAVSAYKNANVWQYFNIVGIEVGIDTPEPDVIKVYPNPVGEELTIKGNLGDDNSEYSIYSVAGQRMMQGQLPRRDAIDRVATINVATLPSGVYLLRLAGASVKFVKK